MILGSLAIAAVPSFYDMQNDARLAAAQAMGGILAGAIQSNYNKGMAGRSTSVIYSCDSTMVTSNLASGMASAPAWHTIIIGGTSFILSFDNTISDPAVNGAKRTCRLSHSQSTDGRYAEFQLIACRGPSACN